MIFGCFRSIRSSQNIYVRWTWHDVFVETTTHLNRQRNRTKNTISLLLSLSVGMCVWVDRKNGRMVEKLLKSFKEYLYSNHSGAIPSSTTWMNGITQNHVTNAVFACMDALRSMDLWTQQRCERCETPLGRERTVGCIGRKPCRNKVPKLQFLRKIKLLNQTEYSQNSGREKKRRTEKCYSFRVQFSTKCY